MHRWWYGLVVLIASIVASPRYAHACSPTVTPQGWIPPTITAQERIDQADVIVEGFIISVDDDLNSHTLIATIKVERYLKGSGEELVFVHGFGYGTDCLTVISEGTHTVIDANEIDGVLWTTTYRDFDLVEGNSAEEISELTGQYPIEPSPLSPSILVEIAALVIVGIFAAIMMLLYFRHERQDVA